MKRALLTCSGAERSERTRMTLRLRSSWASPRNSRTR